MTSEKLVVDMRRANRRTPMKSRKPKTDNFCWAVWRRWSAQAMGSGENILADTPAAEESIPWLVNHSL